jgi:hypothetical protein
MDRLGASVGAVGKGVISETGNGRETAEGTRVRASLVVLPLIEARALRDGGGPMDPSVPRGCLSVGVMSEMLMRTLLPSAETRGVSEGPSVSDVVDNGRGSPGVVKMDESRRWCPLFDDGAGVVPAVPRTPIRLFSFRESKLSNSGEAKEKRGAH